MVCSITHTGSSEELTVNNLNCIFYDKNESAADVSPPNELSHFISCMISSLLLIMQD